MQRQSICLNFETITAQINNRFVCLISKKRVKDLDNLDRLIAVRLCNINTVQVPENIAIEIKKFQSKLPELGKITNNEMKIKLNNIKLIKA